VSGGGSLTWGRPGAAPRYYSDDLGWKTQQTSDQFVYTGYYRVVGLRFDGYIRESKNGGQLYFFVRKPPIQLIRDTEFAGCFHARNDDWFLVGFKDRAQPKDVNSGIAAIQRVLLKAFRVRMAHRGT
jgi:hypothetical protein